MPYTGSQLAGFRVQFVKTRKRQLWVTVALVTVCVAGSLSILVPALPIKVSYQALPIVALGFMVVTLVNWRCPACNSYLGSGTWGLAFCPRCGVGLK
jgi:hypothetical protein